MEQIKGKSKIYNICLKNISTVNSFVWGDENNSFNHFEIMVKELEQFIQDQIDKAYEAGKEDGNSVTDLKYFIK